MSVVDIIREVMTLTTTVGALRGDVDRLVQKVEDHHERVIKLESREEYLMEKMANTALEGVQRMTLPLIDRIVALEIKCGEPRSGSALKQIE